jgi:biotin transport system ATP-binding protein
VLEDVAFGLRKRLGKDELAARVDEALATYGLAGHADHPTHLLSGGQQQLLALVCVLVSEPSILVLDEPTTLLDLRNTRKVASTVAGLSQQVVMVTHDLDLLDDFDRVLVFDDARLAYDGPPREAVAHYTALMGA